MEAREIEALWMLGYLYLQYQRTGEALTVFRALARLLPEDARIRHSLAYAELRSDQPRAALASLAAVPVDPEPAAVALMRSQAYWQLGRADEARHWLQRFLDTRDEA